MRIELSGGRHLRIMDVTSRGNSWASITVETEWPAVSVAVSKISPSELRAIAAECTRIADLLDPDVITSTKAA